MGVLLGIKNSVFFKAFLSMKKEILENGQGFLEQNSHEIMDFLQQTLGDIQDLRDTDVSLHTQAPRLLKQQGGRFPHTKMNP